MNDAYAHHQHLNVLRILDILNEMRAQGLEVALISLLLKSCMVHAGIRDLMDKWFRETDSLERTKIIGEMQKILEDISDVSPGTTIEAFSHFCDFENIKGDIQKFKRQLREEIDRQGGVSELARKTGMPQPSLSRFFTTNSMPRRTTLYKIAKALNLPASYVGFKWSK